MPTKENNQAVVPRGTLGELSGYLLGMVVTKNNVIYMRSQEQIKKALKRNDTKNQHPEKK